MSLILIKQTKTAGFDFVFTCTNLRGILHPSGDGPDGSVTIR
jgi:hypothetical protein